MVHPVRLDHMLKQVPDFVIQADLDGKILYINHILPQYTMEEVLTKTVYDFLTPENRSIMREALDKVRRTGEPALCELIGPDKHGGEAHYVSRIGPVLCPEGKEIVGFFYISTDETDRKRAQLELRSSEEKLRLLSRKLVNAQEEERTRISQEVHDGIGQLLTAIKFDLNWLKDHCPPDAPDELKGRLDSATGLVNQAIQKSRQISIQLRPGVLNDLGLVGAIDWQKCEFERRTGIEVKFETCPEEIEIKKTVATGFFRILQEALTNIGRHASASQVLIRLWASSSPSALNLLLRDNGKGFDVEHKDTVSLGLLGMRERAHAMGGNLQIKSQLGKGTELTLTVPLKTS